MSQPPSTPRTTKSLYPAVFDAPRPSVMSTRGVPELPLESKLSILDGVSTQREHYYQSLGIGTWKHLRESHAKIPQFQRSKVLASIETALSALARGDTEYFEARLIRPEYWRIAAAFPERTLFLDIETTGLSRRYHQLTLIGWSQGEEFRVVSANENSPGLAVLRSALIPGTILVTYNGSHFDVPFLRHALPDLKLPTIHIDLRHLGQRVGLVGGQKKVEILLGLERDRRIAGLAGEMAPALWFRYQRGDLSSLEELVRYNHADVEGLKLLLESMTQRLSPGTTFAWPRSRFESWEAQDLRRSTDRVLVPYIGEAGPRIRFSDLELPRGLRVVGIDLSGGPGRPTGWALLHGNLVETEALREDEEIVERTVTAQPTIVSIDAPLSLPRGRVRVTDDDPGRDEFGIMREAERILRSRGVNTYPALIKSMQGLTARGIRLAALFRSKGVPVIESFPGAMQDILGMPRKGMSLPALKLSLEDYGLTGRFLSEPVIHDEIDAISSAIVGQLFWADRFEALGNSDEDYLIVPSVAASAERNRIITISGPVAAGKTTLAAELESLGATRARYSEVLSDLLNTTDRSQLRRLGADFHSEGRQRWLSQEVYDRISSSPLSVVDGVRYLEDFSFFRERAGSHHTAVFLEAPVALRSQRYLARTPGPETFEEADADSGEAWLLGLRDRATLIVDNSGSLYDLKRFARALIGGKA